MDEDVSDAEASAMRSVATFLDRERAQRRSARRTWSGSWACSSASAPFMR